MITVLIQLFFVQVVNCSAKPIQFSNPIWKSELTAALRVNAKQLEIVQIIPRLAPNMQIIILMRKQSFASLSNITHRANNDPFWNGFFFL